MLISCDRCSTTYTLDDALIPAAGAQVQCTRCGNVFTAQRPGPPREASSAETLPPPAPSRPKAPAPAGNKTMIFGGPSGALPQQPKAPAPPAAGNKTMIFGGPSGSLPEQPKAPPPPAAGNKTMIFGGPSGSLPEPVKSPAPPRPAAPAPVAPPNRTMIFGGPTGAPPEPARPAPAGSKTMIFGGPAGYLPEPTKPAATAAPASKTMIFGGPAGSLPEPTKPAATAAAAPTNKTMIFGGPTGSLPEPSKPPGPPPAAPANKTMIFGGPAGSLPANEAKPQARAGGGKTMIFGGPAGNLPEPAAPAAPAPTSRTMIFGGPSGGAPEAPRPQPRVTGGGGKTMIFGGPGGELPAEAEALLDALGGDDAPPPPVPTSRTLIFGPPGEAGVSDDSGQVVFGADDARDHPQMLTEGTVRIDQDDLERMRREHDAGAMTPPEGVDAAPEERKPRQKTQPFSVADSAAGEETSETPGPARHDKTQQFAMNDAVPEGEGELPPPAPAPRSTQLFAMSDQGPVPAERSRTARTDPALASPAEPEQKVQVDASIVDTLEPDVPPPVLSPTAGARPRATDLLSTTQPNVDLENGPGPDAQDGGLELPPEMPNALGSPDQWPSAADGAALARAQTSQRNRVATLVIAALIGLMVLVLAWALVGKALLAKVTGRDVPVEALQTYESSITQLRNGDSRARETAIAQLRGLVSSYPDLVQAHAGLVTALALEFDQASESQRRFAQTCAGLEVRIKRYEDTKAPANWETERALGVAKLKQLKGTVEGFEKQAGTLRSELNSADNAMGHAAERQEGLPVQAQLAVKRATALKAAVRGDGAALAALSEWTKAGGDTEADTWAQLVPALLALNRKPVDPAELSTATDQLKKIVERDSTMIPALLLLARAELEKGEIEPADEIVERVLAMKNMQQVLAQHLKARIVEARAELEAAKPQEPPPEVPAVP